LNTIGDRSTSGYPLNASTSIQYRLPKFLSLRKSSYRTSIKLYIIVRYVNASVTLARWYIEHIAVSSICRSIPARLNHTHNPIGPIPALRLGHRELCLSNVEWWSFQHHANVVLYADIRVGGRLAVVKRQTLVLRFPLLRENVDVISL
jgi:hypothetical protein